MTSSTEAQGQMVFCPPYGYCFIPNNPMTSPMNASMPMMMPPTMFPPQAPFNPQMMAQPSAAAPTSHDAPHWGQQFANNAMMEGLLGEQAGVFKELMHSLGVDDKEFWKGAMIGAVAALILSNDNVRNTLTGLLGSAGGMVKSSGDKLKTAANTTASSVSNNVQMSAEVVKDTVAAGKAGFKASVSRQRTVPTENETEATDE